MQIGKLQPAKLGQIGAGRILAEPPRWLSAGGKAVRGIKLVSQADQTKAVSSCGNFLSGARTVA